MLSERIKTLYDALNLSGKEVAASAHVSGSAVSVLKSGKKVPPKHGSFMDKYADAIITLSRSNDSLDTLKKLINEKEEPLLKEKLLDWLYDDPVEKNTDAGGFRRKLSLLMTKLGISNVSLAKSMNVDPSVVSRIKSGERSSSPIRSEHILSAARSIALKIHKNKDDLDIASSVLSQELDEGMDETILEKIVFDWLTTDQSENSRGIQDILATVTTYGGIPAASSSLSAEALIESIGSGKLLKEDANYYKGIAGLQTAVLRFLCSALKENARELYLFSNQSMEWMLLNPEFLKKWASLMFLCTSSGIKIKIIHNINRSLPEMLAAIKSWIPLYITGMIEPFYIDNLSAAPLEFSNTIFLAPGIACVNAGHPSNADDQAIYRYDTEAPLLSAHKSTFRALLGRSRKLIKIRHSISSIDSEQFIFPAEYSGNIGLFADGRSATVIKTSTPHLAITFYHPLMRRAFVSFMANINKN